MTTTSGTADAIQRGEHVATIFICKSCHNENLGGELYFAVPGMLTIPTPNLTSGVGGIGGFYTDEDWVHAIRHGVGHDGRALFILMPSNTFHYLSDEDLGALIAYLKSVPPVDNELPVRRIEPLGRLMMAIGMFPPPPGGRQLDEQMPWKFFGQLTDEELRALWMYLQSLPALKQAE